jgi:LysM repeat protein
VKGFLKALFVLLLTGAVFGGGGYYTYLLYIRPEIELEREKNSPTPAAPAFTDPTLAEYQKCLQIEAIGDPLASRRSYSEFLDSYPDSSKADEARTRLGAIQTALLFNPRATPEKQIVIVKSGDVLNKLSHKLKTSPELLTAINHLESPNLRVGQRLYSVPANFSVLIDRTTSRVTVLRGGEFFTQYPILGTQGNAHLGPPKKGAPTGLVAKVQDKPGWKNGARVSFGEKGFGESTRWVVLSPPGHSLYIVDSDSGETVPKPPSGYGLAANAVRELSALLRKNDTVTIK